MKLISYNPANGQKVGEVEISTKRDVLMAVDKAKEVFPKWKKISAEERTSMLRNFVRFT